MIDIFKLIENEKDPEMREWLKDPKNMLLAELFKAEMEARKGGKRKTGDCHKFEMNLMENLTKLRDALWDYSYKPSRGAVHVVKKPVRREIFAAPFVDRVVHHWIIMQITDWWERRLYYGSCSCRVGKGTSYGVKLLDRHIRKVSRNFTRDCVVVKLDISGYFMHIRRDLLYKRVKWGLERQFATQLDDKRYKILLGAVKAVIFDEPVEDVVFQGEYEDWRDLLPDKSLFAAAPLCGIVIGNLTSQFFSNIYLDLLDRYITMTLGYKHYVRYVDDFCIVVTCDEVERLIKEDTPAINAFLNGLGLFINSKKTRKLYSWQGVPFLGFVVRNGAVLPGKRVVKNFRLRAFRVAVGLDDPDTVTSYLGLLLHSNCYRVCAEIFDGMGWEYRG